VTLTEFLLARIAEDEGCALALPPVIAETVRYERIHFAQWNPARARVLAECEAKRRIVALHGDGGHTVGWTKDVYGGVDHACLECGTFDEYGVEWPCTTLRILALLYTDHPDYVEEWRP
jgi:hypothetical protein